MTNEEVRSHNAELVACIKAEVERVQHVRNAAPKLKAALEDMLAGWKYIREHHGDLYGVGWDRAQTKAEVALAAAEGHLL